MGIGDNTVQPEVIFEYEETEDAEERLIEIFEYLLVSEKTLDIKR